MTLPTHLALGLLVGKATGDYTMSLIGSAFVDIDHLHSYVKSGVIKSPKKFWQTITTEEDPYGNQRGLFHNVWFWAAITALTTLIWGTVALPFMLGWLSNLFLDAIDSADYWPFYPNKAINIKGPINYASRKELLFCAVLVAAFLVWYYLGS